MLPKAYGEFISTLAEWDWFVTITFREVTARDLAVARIEEWLADIQGAVGGKQIGWMLAEEFGRLGGRYHCHLLVTGVVNQTRTFWWREAFRRFGRTVIDPFDPQEAAAYYAAKYAAKELGFINFGGTLTGKTLHQFAHTAGGRREWRDALNVSSPGSKTHGVVSPSVDLERDFYRLTFNRARSR
jgi:hypothetical protein